jgi:hypothetical protein
VGESRDADKPRDPERGAAAVLVAAPDGCSNLAFNDCSRFPAEVGAVAALPEGLTSNRWRKESTR